MPERILEYSVLDFANHDAAVDVAAKIMDFVGTPKGSRFSLDPDRAVVWIFGGQLFVSDGALRAAAATGLTLSPSGRIASDQLPAGRLLICGDATDWNS
ncbi:MAG: hypothetical protein HY238_12695 [Acidobacteria bacterium]|nr:hypothetical protein [Acidobacteriota bacterium]